MNQDNKWLLRYAEDRHSQSGEDGILAKMLQIVPETTGWCVEFGAWDGKHKSNTYELIDKRSYNAVLIEGSAERFVDLQTTFAGNERVHPVNAFVGFEPDDNLDTLLRRTPIPNRFDILSIDIDGNDYHVWEAITEYQASIVLIEYNPTIPSAVDFVQPRDMGCNQGNSIKSVVELGERKGYELVCVTALNCIFVRKEIYDLFSIADNSIYALRPDESKVTWIFNGYDGTVFVRGYGRLGWHRIPYRERSMQLLPSWLRQFPDNRGAVRAFLAKTYRSVRKRLPR
ncbi:MAG: hypothetical protein QNJ91_15180 [Gammaproteobacteria bacterium]|nr:hypothetical protein [Gammaproteobacteria bacterium]